MVDRIGFTLTLLGFSGIAGALDLDKNIVVPTLITLAGALLMIYGRREEIFEEKNNSNTNRNNYDDARPYFLR